MMRKDLFIPVDGVYSLLLIAFIFGFFNITFDLTAVGLPLEAGRILLYIGIMAGFIASLILIIDVFSNDVNGKYLWTLAILLSGGIFGFFYLRSRDEYVKSDR